MPARVRERKEENEKGATMRKQNHKDFFFAFFLFLFVLTTFVNGGFAFAFGATRHIPSTFVRHDPFCGENLNAHAKTRLSATPSEKDGEPLIRTTNNFGLSMKEEEENKSDGAIIDLINSIMKESRRSYAFIEGHTFRLLSKRPAVAFAIFVGMGLLVAYMMGFFFS
mmetsp:Transcript_10579/g.16219  ORF Transcript_10579/g.16219 Transcript_10579/m.16219 type:complete len:167 (+) Transcript_10579:26-526(+)